MTWREVTKTVTAVVHDCCQVDVGALKARAVDTAIRKAGGDRAGAFALTKAVRAAAACINGDG